jgi:hypothetical protein
MTDARVNVTLVHGTWARRAKWTRTNSALATRLVCAGAACTRFQWSGRNSHRARIRAARRLADHLRAQHALEPDIKQAVVAHSHGGNVALHAVWRLLEVDSPSLPVVTLATPFLFAHRKKVYSAVLYSAGAVGFLLVFFPVLFLLALPGATIRISPSAIPLLAVTSVVILQALAFLYWLASHGLPWRPETQERFVKQVAVPAADDGDLLVIRAAADEAGITLAATQVSGWVADLATRLMQPWAWSTVYASLSVLSVPIAFLKSSDYWQTMGLISLIAVGTAGAVSLVLVSVPALLSLSQGLDGPTTSLFAVVTAEATPLGRHLVRQQPIRVARSTGLAHSSLYDDPQAIEWIIEHFGLTQQRSGEISN